MPPESPTPTSVSNAELEVLKVLWNQGACTVRDVESALKRKKRKDPWAYTTILTLLSRLRDKGYVAQERPTDQDARRSHRFHPTITRQMLLGRGLVELADRICDGTATPLVHALVQTQKLKPAEITELRKMLNQLEGKE